MLVIFTKIASVFMMVAVGFAANKLDILPREANKYLTDLIMLIICPCMVISALTGADLQAGAVSDIAIILIGNLIYYIVIIFLSWLIVVKVLKIPASEDAGVYMICITSLNNGFMGWPITLALFGEQIFFYMVLCQIALIIFLYTGGVLQLEYDAREAGGSPISFRALVTPCTVACIIGIFLMFTGIRLPELIQGPIDSLAAATTPLSMMLVGMLLGGSSLSRVLKNRRLVISSVLKMLLCPCLTYLAVNWLPIAAPLKLAFVFSASFPSATATAAVVGIQGKNAELAAEMTAFTILLSMITLPLAALFLSAHYGIV